MRPDILPRLVNGAQGDPAVYAPFKYERRALLFDLGDLNPLSSRSLLKVSHIFVSHTHVDHFVGFDQILRLHLGREKRLVLYGPPGFVSNVEGKLRGYIWNLVKNYPYDFRLEVYELGPELPEAASFAWRRMRSVSSDSPGEYFSHARATSSLTRLVKSARWTCSARIRNCKPRHSTT